MNLSAPFINRPVMTTFIMITIILAGMIAFFKLPVNDLPTIEHPHIQVTILDSSGAGLPSNAPNGAMLLSDINSPFPLVLSFSTSSNEAPVAGGPPISIAAPIVTSAVSPVPEPPSFWLVAIALIVSVPVSLLRRERYV